MLQTKMRNYFFNGLSGLIGSLFGHLFHLTLRILLCLIAPVEQSGVKFSAFRVGQKFEFQPMEGMSPACCK